jgi:hypothetical protein
MIEWINITPETDFPRDTKFLVRQKDGDMYVLSYFRSYEWCEFRDDSWNNDFKLTQLREDFTHYAIINLP